MGTNKRLITSATGFPGTNKTLRFIRDAIDNPVTALAMLAGKRVILSGVELVGGVYTDGWVAIDGEILPFTGGTPQANITITEVVENEEYDYDGNNDGVKDILPAYKTRSCGFGTSGVSTFLFSALVRLPSIEGIKTFMGQNFVIDSSYVHTDNNLTTAMINAWNSIVSNIQADWNATTGSSVILNKPTNLLTALYKGYVLLDDINNDANVPVVFPSIGTSQYMVVGSLRSMGSNWNSDNDVFWNWKNPSATGFELLLKEVSSQSQNLRFYYTILAL